ncbi:hypothetical protein ACFX2K_032389 [Malus domestica]
MSSHAPTSMHASTSQSHEPSAPSQQLWLTDSEASSHMTADLTNLSLASSYPTNDTIQTTSRAGLSISHIGSSTLHTSFKPLQLNSVLYDKATGRILFQGKCSNGLYPILISAKKKVITPSAPTAYLGHRVSSSL